MALTATSFMNNSVSSVANKKTGVNYLSSGTISRLNAQRQQSYQDYLALENQNNGGFLGGLGYLGEKVGLGFLSGIEGIWDYGAGGIAKLFGADDWAEQQFANDWVNYNHADEWYNPSEGWQVAGDVAGGIGTSLPALAGVAVGAAIAYFSSGTLTPLAASIISGSIAGLGAAGNATKEAYRQSGELGAKEFGYGFLSGATEAGVEMLTAGMAKGSGRIVSSIAKTTAKETAETVAKTGAKTVIKNIIEDFATEAFEEGLAEVLDPVYQRMTFNPDAENATPQEVAYAALVGGLSGLVMSGGSTVIGAGVNTTQNLFSGTKAIENGTVGSIMETARQLTETENANDTGYASFQTVKNTYDQLSESLKTTGGEVQTVKQKMLLGQIKRANTASIFMPFIERSAVNILANAESVAQRYSEFGMKDANGKPLNLTADAIRSGVDSKLLQIAPQDRTKEQQKTLVKQIRTALTSNSALATLAVADATGHITMNTQRFAEAALNGVNLANSADLNYFVEHASNEQIEALSTDLGISDWSAITIDDFRAKVAEFATGEKISEYAKQSKRIRTAMQTAQETAKPIPHILRRNMSDGVYRFSSENSAVNMAVFKEGESYHLFDYDSGNISRSLTVQEVNKVLRTFWNTNTVQTAAIEQTDVETDLRRQTLEIDAMAKERIPEYHTLSEPNKQAVRMTLRQAQSHGIADAEALTFARVAARSGMNIVFDSAKSLVGDATIQGNTIYIDPNAPKERLESRLLLHEVGHALLRKNDGKNLVAEAFKHIAPVKSQEIAQRYIDFYKNQGMSMEQYIPIVNEEITTAYIEDVLGDANAWEYILSEEPSLSDKVLSFFRKAARDYSTDEKLSSEARKLLRTYKNLFAELSVQNQGNNALELARQDEIWQKNTATSINDENMQVAGDNYVEEQAITGTNIDTDTKYTISKGKAEKLKNDLVKLGTLGIRLYTDKKSIRILTDKFTKNKNIFSTKGRNMREVNARIKAIPNFEDILRSCTYEGSDTEIHGLESEEKKGVIAIHRFKGTYKGFDIEAVIRDKGAKQFLYEIKFIEKEKGSQQSMADGSASSAPLGDAENTPIITHTKKKSNTSDENFSKKFSDGRHALPNTTDKVTVSKGALQKQKANYTSDAVYSRKDVEAALNGIKEFKLLPTETRKEIFNDLWNGLNSHVDKANREKFVDVISKKISHTVMLEARTEESYNKLQALKAEKKKAAETLEGDVRDETLKKLNKEIKEIERDPSRLVDVYDQSQTNKLSDDVVLSLHKLLDSGKPSVKAKLQEEFDTSTAGYWKAKYSESNERNKTLGLLMSKAQQMKDLKLGTFANSTQHDSEIFKNSIEQLARIQYRGNLNVTGTRKILADLRKWYTSEDVKTGILGYVDTNSTGQYVQGVADMLETLSEDPQKTFTKEDLKMLYDVMSYFTNFVENWGKVFRQGKWIEAKPEAERYINILRGNENLNAGLFNRATRTLYMQYFGDPMVVARCMDLYEKGFYTEMLQELRDAAVDAQVAEMEIRTAYDEFTNKNKTYVKKASVETVTYRGTEIQKLHLIGLYMTMKRKHAWAGIAANGFAFTDTKGKRVRVSGVVDANKKITNAELEQYIKKQLSSIESLLSDTDKEYIKILEKAFNEDARKLKADRDIQRLGFTNATNDYYYPIRRGNIAKNVDTSDIAGELDRVSNSSFNKDTVQGAKQELFIESADAVFNRHIHAVCQYAFLSPAVETYNRLYNLDISGNPNKPISVATESANTWDKGNKYFVKLISDIQGIPASSSEGMKALGFIRGNYAKFQLGANPKVWFTQLSSIFASSSLLDADSITRGMAVSSKDIDQYCSLAKLRNNDNTAAMAQGILDSKSKRVVGAISKFGDVLMTPIGKMDRFVVGRLFGACQVQIEKNGGAKVGTEANKVEAGKLLRTVILETQQNSIATERSAAMRSGNEIMRTLTMFTSDSMKVIGRVIDGIGEVSVIKAKLNATTDTETRSALKQQLKVANRKARKSIGALCLSAVFMASIAQLFRWLYDKEQDEDESVAETMLMDAVGNLFGGLPLIKDAYASIFDGYDIENYAYSAVNDLIDSAKNLFNISGSILVGEASPAERNRAVRNMAYSVGQLLGVPVRNVYNVFYGLTKRFDPETAYVIDNAFYEKNYQTELYKAIEEDDAEMTSFIMSLLLGERMSEDMDEGVFNELLLLSKNGQKVIPKRVPTSITIGDTEYPLSVSDQTKIKTVYATSQQALKTLFAKSKYKNLSDEQKVEAIDYIYDTYYDKALEDALGVDRGNNSLIIADVVGVDNLALLYVTTKGLTSDTDARGNVINGSKRKKVVDAINSLGVSNEKKLLLICAKGYSLQDNDIRGLSAVKAKRYLLKYILSLKGATKDEKAQIAELCGFEVVNGRIIAKNL